MYMNDKYVYSMCVNMTFLTSPTFLFEYLPMLPTFYRKLRMDTKDSSRCCLRHPDFSHKVCCQLDHLNKIGINFGVCNISTKVFTT